MSNAPFPEIFYVGNKAFLELYNVLKEDMSADKAAEAVSRMYENCGTYGYRPGGSK